MDWKSLTAAVPLVAIGFLIGAEYKQATVDFQARKQVVREEQNDLVEDAIGAAKGGWSQQDVQAIRLLARKRPLMMNWAVRGTVEAPSNGLVSDSFIEPFPGGAGIVFRAKPPHPKG